MIVVDTNVWSETLRPTPDSRVLSWLREHSARLHLTVVTVQELRYGAQILPAGRRREALAVQIERMLEQLRPRILVYDEPAARAHADVRALARTAGRSLSAEDDQLLGIASANRARIATRNVRDFIDLGVEVVNPWE